MTSWKWTNTPYDYNYNENNDKKEFVKRRKYSVARLTSVAMNKIN